MYFNVTGLKLQNNNIWMKYGIEVKSVSGNILHPLKKLYNLQKNIASNESAFLTGVFKFKAGLPGNYKIIIYAYDGYTNQKVSTEVLYQIIDKDSPSFKVADLQEKAKENVSEINQDIFDKKLFPSLYKKETAEKKDTPEIRTTPDSGYKKSLLDEAGEYPDSNIKIFHEKKGLFAFKYPRDWIIEKEDEFYKKYIYVKDPLGEATIMVYLTLTHQDTREQIIEKRKQIIKECFPGLLEISSLEKITIVGKNALNCKFKGFAYSNLPALGELTIISNDQENYALYVFLAANKDNYEVFRNSYMLVIKSFKITHSIETDKEAMSNLIGTWQYSDSEKGSIEKIISFYTNGRFNQNRQNFNYSISKMPLEYVWEAYDSGSDTLDNNGKYKVVGDTLYLFYDNGSNYEFALTLGDGDFIKMNQTYYRRKM
ncbi:MAG: hypothetical protein HY934_09040 [Candidatus Firestonebacteria bacterium]|nr:hypothetical protein [Candidatus Firestonebacteria bacterium]